MADIDELVFKVGVEVESDQLKRLNDEIEIIKKRAADNAIKLGINPQLNNNQIPSSQTTIDPLRNQNAMKLGMASSQVNNNTASSSQVTSDAISGNYSEEMVGLLSLSEKHMLEMLNIMKKDNNRKERTTDADNKGSGSSLNMKGPIPFVQDIANSNIGSLAGGAVGGALGAFGGPAAAIAGAQLGSAIGGLIQQITGNIEGKIEGVAQLLDTRLAEDIHFRQLSQQTGMAADSIYKLSIQAKLAGTTLEAVVDSNQQLADQLMGGMSDKQAEMLMALNINPRQVLMESGGDIGKVNQMIYERSMKATQGMPSYQRNFALNLAGISTEMQTARKYLYRKDVSDKAEEIKNTATNNGKTPFKTGDALQSEIIQVKGAEFKVQAQMRELLTQHGLAAIISTDLMKVKATTINIMSGVIHDIMDGKTAPATSVNKTKVDTLTNSINSNVNQKNMIQQHMHHKQTVSPKAGQVS